METKALFAAAITLVFMLGMFTGLVIPRKFPPDVAGYYLERREGGYDYVRLHGPHRPNFHSSEPLPGPEPTKAK